MMQIVMTALMAVFGMMCALIAICGVYICAKECARDIIKEIKRK